jgi:hypothetical protein
MYPDFIKALDKIACELMGGPDEPKFPCYVAARLPDGEVVMTGLDDTDKGQVMAKMLAASTQATAVACLMDAWEASVDKDKYEPGMRPSESPDRREVVVVLAHDGKEKYKIRYPVVRDALGRKFGERDEMRDVEGADGWIYHVLPLPEKVTDVVKAVREGLQDFITLAAGGLSSDPSRN